MFYLFPYPYIVKAAYRVLRTPEVGDNKVYLPYVEGPGMAALPEAFKYCDSDGFYSNSSQIAYNWVSYFIVSDNS